ncbi:hypothetical protein GSI_06839 [Ganoderma sinense ZZ0214-1]|uniref:Transporter n=1 Tax=Ganoderma sinense ZZ0214-1 TaxID=1077348 RepID=A0A2G8SEF3_9APHY|nr:hypothetical protein GSI_06839 [Ganoderma sinense ZZ0214-1]
MLFRSFPAYSHVLALILSSLLLLSLPDAASGTQNVTIRFDSSQVSFTTGWRVAEFTGSGSFDKFAFANNPGEEVIVQLPQNVTALSYRGFKIRGGAQYFVCLDCSDTVSSALLSVDAHDDTDNGTQPPDTLFALSVDPTQTHVLRVINLEDDRFNDTSQITGGNPTTTVPVSPTDGRTASTVPSSVGSSSPSVSASQSLTSGPATVGSNVAQGQTASVSNNESSVSQTQTASNASPTSTESQTQTGSNVTGSTTSSGGSQSTTPTTASPNSGSGSSSTASSGSEQTSGSSSTNSPSNGGISKTVIIVVAVIASVFVLALLAAITWLLIRNQPAPRGDVEGSAGQMREAAPTAIMVSNPLPLSPMRPEIPNPFVDPLDDLSPPPRPAPLFGPTFQVTGQHG